jgi:hypothetical protein
MSMGFFDVSFTDLVAAHQRDKIKEANEDALYELEKQTREINKARKQAAQDQIALRNQMVTNELETFQDPPYTPEQHSHVQEVHEQSLMKNNPDLFGYSYRGYAHDDFNGGINSPPSDHLEILKIRLAKGEITINEFKKIKTALNS